MLRKSILILFMLLFALSIVDAQAPGADGIGDPFFPEMGNGGYDVQHYTLDLAIDTEANEVSGTATINAYATQDLSSFNLDFNTLTIEAVIVNDAPAAYAQEGNELIVTPVKPIANGDIFSVVVAYYGDPEAAAEVSGNIAGGWHNLNGNIHIFGEPSIAWMWYPVNGHPLDKATYTLHVTVDDPYMAVANGTLGDTVTNPDGTVTYTWQMNDQMASYLVTLNVVRDYVAQTSEGPNGLPIINYFPADKAEEYAPVFAQQGEIIEFFSEHFGPYPFDSYGALVVEGDLGFALETQSLSVFGALMATAPDAESVVAHELAHQWFGNSLSLSNWQDIWLNEGFAVYATALWDVHVGNIESLDHAAHNWHDVASGDFGAMAPDSDEQPSNMTGMIPSFALVEMLNEIPPEMASIMPAPSYAAIIEALGHLDFSGLDFSAETARSFLEALPEGAITDGEIDDFLQGLPSDEMSWDSLLVALNTLSLDDVEFSFTDLADLVETLPLADIMLDIKTIDSMVSVLLPGMFALDEADMDQMGEMEITSPGSPGPDSLFNLGVYQWGGLTLYALQQAIGDEAFFETLSTYYERFAGHNATTADFIAVAEEVSGQELDDLFDEWLYNETVPEFPAEEATSSETLEQYAGALDDLDAEMFERLAEGFAAFGTASDQIWNDDYRLDQMPLMLVHSDGENDQYAYLVNHPDPISVESAQLVELPNELNLPPIYRLDTLPNADILAKHPSFSFFFPVNDIDVYMMKYTSSEVDKFSSPTSNNWMLFVAHEGFHAYQIANWNETLSTQDIANYPLVEENITLALLENYLLVAALSAEDSAARTQALHQFVAVRNLRMEKWDAVADLDNRQETSEGTARYIEHRLGELMELGDANLSNFGREFSMFDGDKGVRELYAFGRFYTTGAVLSHLLDLQGIDWKPRVANGEILYDILAANFDLSDRDALVEQAQAAHDYATLSGQAAELAAQAESETSDIFEDQVASMAGDVLEFPQKPYEVARDDLVPTILPDGYKVAGGYTVSADELHMMMRDIYAPNGNDITFVALEGNGSDAISIYASQHEYTSIAEHYHSIRSFMPNLQLQPFGEQEAIVMVLDGPQVATLMAFLRRNELITIEALLELTQVQAMAEDLLNQEGA